MDIDKEMLKGHIEALLLSQLAEQDRYGYEMTKRIFEKSGGSFELKEGTLYLALKRMEANGLVESYWGNEEPIGGRRKYYRLLSKGKLRLAQKKREWRFIRLMMDTFLEEGNDERR
ncbi:PadR family transcriptional regulator [Paenibacillaceae bacterium]|nr:PadR family transcriptional regulator [Paenibacillaceae bacterium]